MADSRSLRPSPEVVRDWGKWLVTSTISVMAALFTTYKWVDGHATEEEVAVIVAKHDADEKAHKALVKDLLDKVADAVAEETELAKRLEKAQAEAEQDRKSVYWAFWVLTGDKAAEMERDPRKAKLSAEQARDRFEAYYRQGYAPQEALRRALRTPLP